VADEFGHQLAGRLIVHFPVTGQYEPAPTILKARRTDIMAMANGELIFWGSNGTKTIARRQRAMAHTHLKPLPQSAEDGFAAERRAFEHQRVRLMRRYPGQYVALSGGRVVDHDKDDEKLAARMFKELGDGPFYIARLEDLPLIYEVPSPELAG